MIRQVKTGLISIFILLPLFLQAYDQVILRDQKTLRSDRFYYDNNRITSRENPGGIDTASVEMLLFNQREEKDKTSSESLDQVSAEELLKRAGVMVKKYPDASSVVLLDDGVQKLNRDKTQYSRSRYAVKIMNESDLDQATLSFYYTKEEHETRILRARSIQPDGRIYELDLNTIIWTTPKQDLQFFSGRKDAKIMKAVIPGVKVGSIIDYEWETLEASVEDPSQFYTHWYFGGDKPVYESRVRFIVPVEINFYTVVKNSGKENPGPVITTEGEYRIYSFKRGECPPFVPEIQAPPGGEYIPYALGSTYQDQTYLSDWLARFMKERLVINDTIRSAIKKILENSKAVSEEDIIAVVYRFMQEQIRYLSIKTSLSSGFSGHPAVETFTNRYGDCIDKSILFAAILTDLGIKAYPVIVMTNDQSQPLFGEIGVVSGNHAINEIHLKSGRIIYLDSTSTTYRYPDFRDDDHGIKAWNPILNTFRLIDPPAPDQNLQHYSSVIRLNRDGSGSVEKTNRYSGQWDAGLRGYFLSISEAEKKALLENLVAGDFPGSILTGYQYQNPSDYTQSFEVTFNYDARQIGKKTGPYLLVNAPSKFNFEFTQLKERSYDLIFQTTYGQRDEAKYILPEGARPLSLPQPLSIENSFFSYSGSYEFKNGTVFYRSLFKRKAVRVRVSEYQAFREAILKIDNFIKIPLVITINN